MLRVDTAWMGTSVGVGMSDGDSAGVAQGGRLQPGQQMSVTIDRLVFQGDGLGRLPDGRVIFVPLTAPGDEVTIRVVEDRGHFVRGAVVDVRTASPLRVDPPCRHFGTCGGCQWQHVGSPAQLDWKRRILEELLIRVGKLEGVPVEPVIDPGAPWEYRGRAQFKVIGGARPCIGYHQRETNRVVDIDRCPLLDPRLNALLHAIRRMKHPSFFSLFQRLREAWMALGTGTGEILLSLFARAQDRGALRLAFHTLQATVPGLKGIALLEGDPRQGPRLVDWAGSEVMHEQVDDARFRIGGTAFFQVSGLAAGRLTSLILDAAKLTGVERVLELYCGAGTFTVPLTRRAREVVGIETNPAAAADGEANLRENGCPTGRIVQGQVEQLLPSLAGEKRWDLVVLDPPRQGCSRAVIERLAKMRVPRIVYVSCDPSTLARDLGLFAAAGHRCAQIRPIDLFPQTFHLEAVATLERS